LFALETNSAAGERRFRRSAEREHFGSCCG
jgi:hypothetical protein